MNVAGSGRVGSSFSIRVAQNNVLGWRWTVEKEHDGFFEPVASGRSLTGSARRFAHLGSCPSMGR